MKICRIYNRIYTLVISIHSWLDAPVTPHLRIWIPVFFDLDLRACKSLDKLIWKWFHDISIKKRQPHHTPNKIKYLQLHPMQISQPKIGPPPLPLTKKSLPHAFTKSTMSSLGTNLWNRGGVPSERQTLQKPGSADEIFPRNFVSPTKMGIRPWLAGS